MTPGESVPTARVAPVRATNSFDCIQVFDHTVSSVAEINDHIERLRMPARDQVIDQDSRVIAAESEFQLLVKFAIHGWDRKLDPDCLISAEGELESARISLREAEERVGFWEAQTDVPLHRLLGWRKHTGTHIANGVTVTMTATLAEHTARAARERRAALKRVDVARAQLAALKTREAIFLKQRKKGVELNEQIDRLRNCVAAEYDSVNLAISQQVRDLKVEVRVRENLVDEHLLILRRIAHRYEGEVLGYRDEDASWRAFPR